MSSARRVRVGIPIVAVLAAWAGLDVAGRCFPVDWLHILPEHVAARRPGRFHPFIPNLSLVQDPWIGETALAGNIAPTETRPPVRFGTDSLGFRRTPGVPPGRKIDLLLFGGRSFAYGGGLSDDETFPAALTRASGLRTYNAGHFYWDPETLETLDATLAALGHPRPAVLLIHWEDFDPRLQHIDGAGWPTDGPGEAILGRVRYQEWRDELQYARRRLTAWWNISPLEVLSIRLFKWLSDGRILPNPYAANVAARSLPGGRRLLLLREEIDRAIQPPGDATVRRHADYYAYFRQRLQQRGLAAWVILVPNRYSLYGPLTDGPAAVPGPAYLDRLEAALASRGVNVVNGLRVLGPHAAADLATGRMSFYREDHHWSPLGVERIAAATAGALGKEPRAF